MTTETLMLNWSLIYTCTISDPYRWNRGDFRFPRRLSLCPSVRLSVCPSVRLSVHFVSVHSVFRIFLSHPLRYWLEIWYMDSSWHNTDQVWVSSRLTYFYRNYYPLLIFSFPGFSLPSFEILTWNLVYEFALTQYRSSSSFVTLDQLL